MTSHRLLPFVVLVSLAAACPGQSPTIPSGVGGGGIRGKRADRVRCEPLPAASPPTHIYIDPIPGEEVIPTPVVVTVEGEDPKRAQVRPNDGTCLKPRRGRGKNEIACTVTASGGEVEYQEQVLSMSGINGHDFRLTISYTSNPLRTDDPRVLKGPPLGEGWSHNHQPTLQRTDDKQYLVYDNGFPGTDQVFTKIPANTEPSYMGGPGIYKYAISDSSGGPVIVKLVDVLTGTVESFNLDNGLLDHVVHSDGSRIDYYYWESPPDPGQAGSGPCYVSEVVDTRGNVHHFDYTVYRLMTDATPSDPSEPTLAARLTRVRTADGLSASFDYCRTDVAGSCEKGALRRYTGVPVVNPAGASFSSRTWTYGYTGRRGEGGLESVTRPGETTPHVVTTYGGPGDLHNRVIAQACAGGTYRLRWGPEIEPGYCARDVTVVDPLGHRTDYKLEKVGFVREIEQFAGVWDPTGVHRSGPGPRAIVTGRDPGPGEVPRSWTTRYVHNADGEVLKEYAGDGSWKENVFHEPAQKPGDPWIRKEDWARRGWKLSQTVHPSPRATAPTTSGSITTSWTYEECFGGPQVVTDGDGRATTRVYRHQDRAAGRIVTTFADRNGNRSCDPWEPDPAVHGGLLKEIHHPTVTVHYPGHGGPQEAIERFSYNAAGQLERRTDPEGIVTRYEYGAGGRGYTVRQVVDEAGLKLTTEWVRDARGNARETIDPDGIRSTARFNALDLPTVEKPADRRTARARAGIAAAPPRTVTTGYDALGRRWWTTTSISNPATVDQSRPAGAPIASPRAVSTWWTYDPLGNPTEIHRENGARVEVQRFEYDMLGHKTLERPPSGRGAIRTVYDELGRPVEITLAPGSAESATTSLDYYWNTNKVQRTRDPRFVAGPGGRLYETTTLFDGHGNEAGVIEPSPIVGQTDRVFDRRRLLLEETVRGSLDSLSSTPVVLSRSRFSYDERGRRFHESHDIFDPNAGAWGSGRPAAETWLLLDRLGRTVRTRDPNGHETIHDFDGAGRTVRTTLPNGDNTVTVFDGAGRALEETTVEVAAGQRYVTVTGHDAAGNPISIRDNAGNVTRHEYDSQGRRVATVNARGNRTEYGYDALGREIRVARLLTASGDAPATGPWRVDPSQGHHGLLLLERTWNEDGLPESESVGGVLAHRDTYDLRNLLRSRAYPDGTVETFRHDLAGNVQETTRRDGVRIAREFDARNRLLSARVSANPANLPGTTLQTFRYHGAGKLVFSTDNNDPGTPSDDVERRSTFDSLGRALTMTERVGAAAAVVRAGYDANGNVVRIVYPNGRTFDQRWNSLNQLVSIREGGATVDLAQFEYKSSTRYREIRYGSAVQSFEYDALNRVSRLFHRVAGGTLELNYTYDAMGNTESERLRFPPFADQTRSMRYDSADRLLAVDVSAASAGAPADETIALDGRGNRTRTQKGSSAASWSVNALNQYVQAGTETFSWDAAGHLARRGTRNYAFDAFGRLRTVQDGGTAVQFGYDTEGRRVLRGGERIVYWEGRMLQRGTGANARIFVSGNKPEQVLAILSHGGALHPHRDAMASTVAVTDAAGRLVERYEYDSAGVPTVRLASGASAGVAASEVLFAGREYDHDAKLYNHHARWYDPEIARFISPDPAGLTDENYYAYAHGNALRFVDPLGLGDLSTPQTPSKDKTAQVMDPPPKVVDSNQPYKETRWVWVPGYAAPWRVEVTIDPNAPPPPATLRAVPRSPLPHMDRANPTYEIDRAGVVALENLSSFAIPYAGPVQRALGAVRAGSAGAGGARAPGAGAASATTAGNTEQRLLNALREVNTKGHGTDNCLKAAEAAHSTATGAPASALPGLAQEGSVAALEARAGAAFDLAGTTGAEVQAAIQALPPGSGAIIQQVNPASPSIVGGHAFNGFNVGGRAFLVDASGKVPVVVNPASLPNMPYSVLPMPGQVVLPPLP